MSNPGTYLKKTAAIYGGKGGAGKTTSTYELALARGGYQVLLVDLDGGQASLSAKVDIDVTKLDYGLH